MVDVLGLVDGLIEENCPKGYKWNSDKGVCGKQLSYGYSEVCPQTMEIRDDRCMCPQGTVWHGDKDMCDLPDVTTTKPAAPVRKKINCNTKERMKDILNKMNNGTFKANDVVDGDALCYLLVMKNMGDNATPEFRAAFMDAMKKYPKQQKEMGKVMFFQMSMGNTESAKKYDLIKLEKDMNEFVKTGMVSDEFHTVMNKIANEARTIINKDGKYGHFPLYTPPMFSSSSTGDWGGIALLAIGIGAVILFAGKKRRK